MSGRDRTHQAPSAGFSRRQDCRICRGKDLHPFLDLGPMPLAGGFVRPEEAGSEPVFPLTIALCTGCGEVQLLETVQRDILYRDYRFLASTTSTLRSHFATYARDMLERFLDPADLVVEVGANDGVLLAPFGELGVRAVGFEPAGNIARVARSRGCEVIEEFVSPASASRVVAAHGLARLVCANNVFAHIDDMHEAMAAITAMLSPVGLFVFEVHYLVDLLSTYQVDMMYHEHLMHHSLRPLERLLGQYEMEVFDVERIPIHCGSIRVYAQRRGSPRPQRVTPAVAEMRRLEARQGLCRLQTLELFAREVVDRRDRLVRLVRELVAAGRRVVGYGASGRATMHLNLCRFDPTVIPYVVDASPERQGRLVPVTHNPVVSPAAFRADRAEVALLFAYNYLAEVTRAEHGFVERGGRFLVPLPEPTLVGDGR